MKRRRIAISLFIALCLLISMVSCNEVSKNNSEYWFSEYETRFVPYDDSANTEKGNIEDAGNYWKMIVKKDCKLTISVRINTDYFSMLEFSINGVTEKSDDVSNTVYSYIYKDISLKKGDKLEFHALWINSAATNSDGFQISVFTINDGSGEYPIENIK